jgi:phosphate transport system substrate-binding protein
MRGRGMSKLMPAVSVKLCRLVPLYAAWLLFAGAPSYSAGESSDPLAGTKEIDEQLHKLDQTPVGKQIAEIERKFSAATEQVGKAREEVQAQYFQLQQTEAYKEYQNRRQALEDKRDTEWSRERKAMADAARKLYASRHEELRQLATRETPHARELGLDVLTFPRLDGSTSTHPLSVILASRVLGTPYEWIYPEPTGSPWRPRPNLPMDLFLFNEYEYYPPPEKMEFTLAASRVVAKPTKVGQERLAIMINSLLAISTSTHDAYTNLVEGKCDLNLTARAPSEEELAIANKKGVTIKLSPIAKDALVFIVNRKNPIKSIGREEVVQIYQGKIKSWAQFGGVAANIVPLWRERNSGSRELFDALVSKGLQLVEPDLKDELFSNSMAGPFNRVTQDVNSLGYSVFYYEHFMALSPFTRTVAIDGIQPNAESIVSGKYPFTAEVYAAYRADEPQNSPAMKLLAWLLSPEGQAVVRESGYVPAK